MTPSHIERRAFRGARAGTNAALVLGQVGGPKEGEMSLRGKTEIRSALGAAWAGMWMVVSACSPAPSPIAVATGDSVPSMPTPHVGAATLSGHVRDGDGHAVA